MVEIVTLLLGLTIGTQTVELAVGEPVARVELVLDGRTAATLTSEPWSARVDFGDRLEPRLLEAIAFDDADKELGSVRQFINYARSNYEAVLTLGPRTDDGRWGRVHWEAILGRQPKRIDLKFDDREIPVTADGRFELPAHDDEAAHFLSATLRFADGESAEANLVFGGTYGDRVASALTAVPLLLPVGASLPAAAKMQEWFRKGESPLKVFSTSAGPARLMILHHQQAGHVLRARTHELKRLRAYPLPPIIEPSDSVQFVPMVPVPGHAGHFRAVEVLASKKRDGLWNLIAWDYPKSRARGRRGTWASVAAAGRGASAGNRRRAVVVLLGSDPPRQEELTPTQVIGYLASVRVPHYVWAARERDMPRFDDSVAANTYVGAEGLVELFDDLGRSLSSQRIVWIEGAHFPSQVEATARLPDGFRLAR